MLEKINSPSDIKKLSVEQLETLSEEIREKIIATTLENGGHLASNLGSVELTLAIHYVFDAPEDKIVFDVGHQCYTHKLICGRAFEFSTLRQENGISGFPRRSESEYDTFDSGHSSTAISQALGLARARDCNGGTNNVVAVVGDGAIGGGMSFEAINDAGFDRKTKLVIILNDNEMSISKNVGALSGHFSKLRTARGYRRYKRIIKRTLVRVNHSGKIAEFFEHLKNTIRYFLIGQTVFDTMGIRYIGPIDGHSLREMIEILSRAKEQDVPVLVHAITCKGRGYCEAENNPERFHGVSREKTSADKQCFSCTLGEQLCEIAQQDTSICAITAGMCIGTGLSRFAQMYSQRFFDAGIAEQHALGMASGLARGGMRPFVAIYSTFLQRGFDQVFHEICLQGLPVVLCIDRAGLVGEDGATHQGIYDLAFLREMPGLTVFAPRNAGEMQKMIAFSLTQNGPVAIRYAKGAGIDRSGNARGVEWEVLREGNGSILTFGANLEAALSAAEVLNCRVVDARALKPLDTKMLDRLASEPICVIEDNAPEGGICEAILHYYSQNNITARVTGIALKDEFVRHASVERQRELNGLDSASIISTLKKVW